MLLRRALLACSFRGLHNRPEVLVHCLGDSLISCSFNVDEKHHSVASTPCNSLGRFQEKVASAVNTARRVRVARALRKGRLDVQSLPDVGVQLLDATGRPVEPNRTLNEAFQSGFLLEVGSERFLVVRDPPQVTGLALPKTLLTGCPVFLSFRPEQCPTSSCEVTWFVRAKPSKDPPPAQASWEEFHHGPAVLFGPEQVGVWVKARVVPRDESGRRGEPAEVVGRVRVQEGPAHTSPIRARHEETAERAGPGSIRVASYNVLADFYADSDYSRTKLFPHCDPHFLSFQYRQQVLLWELTGYNADVLCLQEVDKDFFSRVLQPFFAQDFEALFLPKYGLKREGLALLFRREKLELERDVSLPCISAALEELRDRLPELDLETAPSFKRKWEERNQALLAVVLRCTENPSRRVLVANTHLYSYPAAGNVRLLQAGVVLKQLELAKSETGPCAVVLAGDFNSLPTSGVFQLATQGRIAPKHCDWFSGGADELFGCPELHHGLRLASMYDPQLLVTTLVPHFCGAVDHVFFSGMQLQRHVPLPGLCELRQFTALPNQFFPSDHLALVGDLKWQEK